MTKAEHERRLRETCHEAGLPDLAGEMIAAGVADATLRAAVTAASGARDKRAAIRAHPGLAAQLASGGSKAGGSRDAAPADDLPGMAGVLQSVAPERPAATDADGPRTAATHQDGWATAFGRAR